MTERRLNFPHTKPRPKKKQGFITLRQFYEEITERPDVRKLLKRLVQ
jgi:hypothetical protein